MWTPWDIVQDTLQGINAIGIWLTNFTAYMIQWMLNIGLLFYYPVAVVWTTIQYDFKLVYDTFVPLINLVISIGNIPIELMSYFPLPPIWTFLLLGSLQIAVLIRLYRWAKEIRGWIPTFSGDK